MLVAGNLQADEGQAGPRHTSERQHTLHLSQTIVLLSLRGYRLAQLEPAGELSHLLHAELMEEGEVEEEEEEEVENV